MTEAEELADEYMALVLKRTGLTHAQLVCPREKSSMTPCLARDGWLVVVMARGDTPICVGCEAELHGLLAVERGKHGL